MAYYSGSNGLAEDELINNIANQILIWSKEVNATASLKLNDYIRLFRAETSNIRYLLVKTSDGDKIVIQEVK